MYDRAVDGGGVLGVEKTEEAGSRRRGRPRRRRGEKGLGLEEGRKEEAEPFSFWCRYYP